MLQPFPAATPNADLQGAAGEAATGAVPIPPDGAVLVATGAEAAKLANEAPAGTQVTARLILPSSWAGVTGAIGGGPLLVRNHKAVFKTSENFESDQLALRDARAGDRPARRRPRDPRRRRRRPARLQRRHDDVRAGADDGAARRRHRGGARAGQGR